MCTCASSAAGCNLSEVSHEMWFVCLVAKRCSQNVQIAQLLSDNRRVSFRRSYTLHLLIWCQHTWLHVTPERPRPSAAAFFNTNIQGLQACRCISDGIGGR